MSGSRLSLARKLRGLSQTELARIADVTPRAISKYEKEGEGLSAAKLAEIATVLQFGPSFFDGDDIEAPQEASISFRARSKISAKKRNQAIAASAFGTMLSDWMDSEFVLPKQSIPDYAGYDPEDAAQALRTEWGLGEGPISDMIALLESHGVRVFSVREASQEIDAYSFWDEARNRPFVFLTTSKSGERRRMDAAHELGHLVLHRKIDIDGEGARDIERQADEFGSAFLMPSRGFRASAPRPIALSEIMRIKKLWKVSAFAVAVRSHRLGLLSDWQYHNLCVNMGRRGMRTSEPNGITPERSQVADKIIAMTTDPLSGSSSIESATEIPRSIIRSLTFCMPVEAVRGGAASPSTITRAERETRRRNFVIIRNGR